MKKLITLTLCIIMSLSSLSIYGCGKCKHTYDEKITKAATCTEIGIKSFTCSSCGDAYTDTIPTTNHSYAQEVVKPTLNEQGYTIHKCKYCGNSYKDSYTSKLAWMDVFLDYISKNYTSIIDKNYQRTVLFDYSIYENCELQITKYPNYIHIKVTQVFESTTSTISVTLEQPREKYFYRFTKNIGTSIASEGFGYFSAPTIYCTSALTFDSYYYNYKDYSDFNQKEALWLLKDLFEAFDKELKSWNLGLDLSYWGIVY